MGGGDPSWRVTRWHPTLGDANSSGATDICSVIFKHIVFPYPFSDSQFHPTHVFALNAEIPLVWVLLEEFIDTWNLEFWKLGGDVIMCVAPNFLCYCIPSSEKSSPPFDDLWPALGPATSCYHQQAGRRLLKESLGGVLSPPEGVICTS